MTSKCSQLPCRYQKGLAFPNVLVCNIPIALVLFMFLVLVHVLLVIGLNEVVFKLIFLFHIPFSFCFSMHSLYKFIVVTEDLHFPLPKTWIKV
jgi:uncharacterized membrane protein YcgQ (UPF0703/DUF1980 family)